MKLLFKQRMFSWFDSYNIYYEDGSTAYTVKGQLSLGHCLKIRDAAGHELGWSKNESSRSFRGLTFTLAKRKSERSRRSSPCFTRNTISTAGADMSRVPSLSGTTGF